MELIKRGYDLDKQTFTRAAEDDSDSLGTFEGHAAVFNQETLIGNLRWGFIEQIRANAFDDVLDDDVRFLFNHDGQPLARTTNGTLRLSQDSVGLVDIANIARTQLGQDMLVLVNRGDISQQSFAFTIADQEWDTKSIATDEGSLEIDRRTIVKIERLYDTSLVTYPAYDGTDGGMRCFRGAGKAEIEAALRESGRSDRDVQAQLQDEAARKAAEDLIKTRSRALALRAR